MVVDSEVLKSISHYNVKELAKGIIINPDIQKLHYVDEKGALTFTTGACVNNFIFLLWKEMLTQLLT